MLYMFLADGFEETEAIATLDVIRRAGLDIKTAALEKRSTCGSHGIEVLADMTADELEYEGMTGVILPGGMPGTLKLEGSEAVRSAVEHCLKNGLLTAAICAAPMILGKMGALRGKKAVCYPSFEEYLEGAFVSDGLVAVDGNIVTGKGAGAAMLFSAAIVDYFKSGRGAELLTEMQHPML